MTDDVITEVNLDIAPYDQLPDEPYDWYERFLTYFVALGQARSLRKAYLLHNNLLAEEAVNAPPANDWNLAAKKYHWKRRAAAYDAEMAVEVARQVEQARMDLQNASVKAVEALVKSLNTGRTRVAGAKAILDRAGLPPVKEVRHSTEPYSGDELAQAAEEVDAWEKQMIAESSGSSVESQ
jgi:hypothetical protein